MKKILLLLAIIISNVSYADNNHIYDDSRYPKGLHIIKDTMLAGAIANNKGFIESEDENMFINLYLTIKNRAPKEIKDFDNGGNEDTHLKSSISKIKLIFPFKKPSIIKDENIIGYAAIGAYDNGWTGVKIFFEREELGICSYEFQNVTAVNMHSSTTNYSVNNKPSTKSIVGNYHNGFVYKVTWSEDKKTSVDYNKLICVNRKMDKENIKKIITLAKQIDLQKS